MCFITGLLQEGDNPIPQNLRELVKQSALSLSHRGPEGTGFVSGSNFELANGRLSFQDLSEKAALPMQSRDKQITLAFNGEISNFKELRHKYLFDEKFESSSDTEVLLALYQKIGIDFLPLLSGMFVCFILDKNQNRAYLIRDFFGIIPMFYTRIGSLWAFASELKGLAPIEKNSLDSQSIFDLFTLAYIPGEKTPYKNIQELKAGHFLEWNLELQGCELKNYYELPIKRKKPPTKIKIAIKRTQELLFQAVERNLISDAPIGFMLSGGIDSSGLLAIANKLHPKKRFDTFSIRVKNRAFDESKYQQLMAQKFNTRHHEISVDFASVKSALYSHMAFMDEPYGHGAAIPTFLLAREARKFVKALLCGEGGDEIFNAYDTYAAWKYRSYYRRLPRGIRTSFKNLVMAMPSRRGKLPLDFVLKRFVLGAELSVPASHIYWRHVLTNPEKSELFFNRDDFIPTQNRFEEEFNAMNGAEELDRLSALDLKNFFVGDLMVKNDRMCMANSLQGRFPYADRDLVEYVQSLPTGWRYRGISRRWLQKKALAGIVPREILARNRFGLELPSSLWCNSELNEMMSEFFTKEKIGATGLLSWKAVNSFREMHTKGRGDYGRFLWTTLLFLIWHEIHVVKENGAELRKEYFANL